MFLCCCNDEVFTTIYLIELSVFAFEFNKFHSGSIVLFDS